MYTFTTFTDYTTSTLVLFHGGEVKLLSPLGYLTKPFPRQLQEYHTYPGELVVPPIALSVLRLPQDILVPKMKKRRCLLLFCVAYILSSELAMRGIFHDVVWDYVNKR